MKTIILLFLGLMLLQKIHCQTYNTTNQGVLYVSPNTLVTVEGSFNNKASAEYENNGEVIFRGNFNNDWITGYNPSMEGKTRFEGLSNQEITGSKNADFKNVLFLNSSPQPAFHLYSTVTFGGVVNFDKGIVNSDEYGGTVLLLIKKPLMPAMLTALFLRKETPLLLIL
jgi:hypothetical protein